MHVGDDGAGGVGGPNGCSGGGKDEAGRGKTARDVCGGRGPAMSPAGRRAPCAAAAVHVHPMPVLYFALRHEAVPQAARRRALRQCCGLRWCMFTAMSAIGRRRGGASTGAAQSLRDDDARAAPARWSGWIGDEREKGEGGEMSRSRRCRMVVMGKGQDLVVGLGGSMCGPTALCFVHGAALAPHLMRLSTDLFGE